MRIAAAIMHVPQARERVQYVAALRSHWPDATVIEDPERRGAWPTARRAWEHLAGTDATHALVLQDDAVPCWDHHAQTKAAVRALPDAVLSFYTRRARFVAQARAAGSSWYWSPDGAYGLALLMPRAWIVEALAWGDAHLRDDYPHDDNRIALWARSTERGVYVSCPSLVSHAPVRSLLRHTWKEPEGTWERRSETTLIDWTRGLPTLPRMPATVQAHRALRSPPSRS